MMLISFMVLAVPIVAAVSLTSDQLVRSSIVYDQCLTGGYGAASGVEFGISEIQSEAAVIKDLEEGESAELSVEINGETVEITITKLPADETPLNPYADVMLTMDSFGDVPVDLDELSTAIRLTGNTVVDAFELDKGGTRVRIGVTRFRNAVNVSNCGTSQSVVDMTDVDYHSGDGGPVREYHLKDHSDEFHAHVDDDEPVHTGIDSLTLHGNDVTSGTNIVKGIKCGVEQYQTGLGDRDFAPNVMIFMTDGEDTLGNGPADIQAEVAAWVDADQLDAVFAIGIGVAYEGGYPEIDSCTDAWDNDNDGDVDAADADCQLEEDGIADSCFDGIDNGGDGLTDGDDPDCQMAEGGFPNIPGSCEDDWDNDNDGNFDGADHDCSLNLNAIAYDPETPNYNMKGGTEVVVKGCFPNPNPNAHKYCDPFAWDHVFQSDDFAGLLASIEEIIEGVLRSGGVGYEITSVASDGSTVVSIVLLTNDGIIVVLSWDASQN